MKLNFIDTDHILDRMLFPDDFSDLALTPHGALFDVGKLPGQDSRVRNDARDDAFESIAAINGNIAFQNKRVDDGTPSFQTLAARRWLDLHEFRDPETSEDAGGVQIFSRLERSGLFDRALATNDAEQPPWSAANPIDFKLLPLLNRYCYRCHSSIRFNVFDRKGVVTRKGSIKFVLTQPLENNLHMPQDRVLPDNVKNRFLELVDKLE